MVIGLCSPVLYFLGEILGIGLTTASESGIFLASIPVASLVASSLVLRKRPRKAQVVGILITLAGVLLLIPLMVESGVSLSFVGYLCLFIAVIAYALYSVSVARASRFTGVEITYAMLAMGAVVFVALAIVEALSKGGLGALAALPFRDRGFLAAILYQGIACSVLAFFLSNVAIASIGVNRTASFIGISTVVAILAGALVLKEPFTLGQTVAALVILAGVYIANAAKTGGGMPDGVG